MDVAVRCRRSTAGSCRNQVRCALTYRLVRRAAPAFAVVDVRSLPASTSTASRVADAGAPQRVGGDPAVELRARLGDDGAAVEHRVQPCAPARRVHVALGVEHHQGQRPVRRHVPRLAASGRARRRGAARRRGSPGAGWRRRGCGAPSGSRPRTSATSSPSPAGVAASAVSSARSSAARCDAAEVPSLAQGAQVLAGAADDDGRDAARVELGEGGAGVAQPVRDA